MRHHENQVLTRVPDRDLRYRAEVNFFDVVLVFVGIPVAVVLVLAAFTVWPARAKERPKYVAGSDWMYPDHLYTGDTPVQVPDHISGSSNDTIGGARGTW